MTFTSSHNPIPRRPKIVVAVPQPHRGLFFPATAWNELEAVGILIALDDFADYSNALREAEISITSWGAPPLSAELLETAPRLRLLAHTGASVKSLVTGASWSRGIRVTQAGAAMAGPVAERALAFTLMVLQGIGRASALMRTGDGWSEAREMTRHELAGTTLGVVGASRTGRTFIRQVQALGARVTLHDPYVSSEEAHSLGVELADLDTVLSSSRAVVLHAPATPRTKHMIGARELALMTPGTALINTARSWLVDSDALLSELKTGRIVAALDVYDAEPLPMTSELRSLPNVVLTPHTAGNTEESRRRAGGIILSEIGRYLAGRPLEHEICDTDLETMG